MVDLYLEANLPAVRPGIRRAYFCLMALNMGFLGCALTSLYATVFERPSAARWGWFFPGASVAAIAADFVLQSSATLPAIVIVYVKIAAPFIAFPIAIVFLTPGRHIKRLGNSNLRRYVAWSFVIFALLIMLHTLRQIAGDRSEFFAVFGRTHFSFSFIIASLISLYFALRFLSKPAAAVSLLAPGEILPSDNFINSYQLTPRERVIISEIMAGKSNREISRTIEVTEGTVKIFVHNIYKKTGVNNRMALAALVRHRMAAD